jgi:hypothetical protein
LFGRLMKAMAINDGDGYIQQQWILTMVIGDSYHQQLFTLGQWQHHEDGNEDGNGARTATPQGQLMTTAIDNGARTAREFL